jgi:hypothetical protein
MLSVGHVARGAGMKSVAQFAPWEYVNKLHDMHVPGYTGFPDGSVTLRSYMSANPMFGGNANAAVLRKALIDIVKDKPEAGFPKTPGFERVFTGQGLRSDMIAVMSIVNTYQAQFKAVPGLVKYFKEKDFLQAMADDACFGLDCIGFVGTYLVDSGLEDSYVGRRPLDYTAVFPPVQSLDEIKDYSVVMLTNGLHIQMIDTVNERKAGQIVVDLCQSTKGGPQTNFSVTIRSGGGDYLPVPEFRAALAGKTYAQDHAADNAARQSRGEKARDYESYLRARMTQKNVSIGYAGGAIFQLGANGEPQNIVGGSVYIGVASGGLSIRTP